MWRLDIDVYVCTRYPWSCVLAEEPIHKTEIIYSSRCHLVGNTFFTPSLLKGTLARNYYSVCGVDTDNTDGYLACIYY